MKFKNLRNDSIMIAIGDLAKDLLKDKNYRPIFDAEFNESDHPRDKDGQFTSGGGGSSKSTEPKKTEAKKENLKKSSQYPKTSSKHPNEIQISESVDVMKFGKEWVITVFTKDGKKGKTFGGGNNKEKAVALAKKWSKLSDPERLELMKEEWEK